jgi:hypothetical protein
MHVVRAQQDGIRIRNLCTDLEVVAGQTLQANFRDIV